MRILLTAIAALTLAAPAAAQFSGQSQMPAPQTTGQTTGQSTPSTTTQTPSSGTAQPQPAAPIPLTENTDASYSAVGIPQTDKVGSDMIGDGTP